MLCFVIAPVSLLTSKVVGAPSDFRFSTILTTRGFPKLYTSYSCSVGSFLNHCLRPFPKRGPMMLRVCFWILIKTKCAGTAIRHVHLWGPILFREITFRGTTYFYNHVVYHAQNAYSKLTACSRPASGLHKFKHHINPIKNTHVKHRSSNITYDHHPILILFWSVCMPLLKPTPGLFWFMVAHIHAKDHIKQLWGWLTSVCDQIPLHS